MSAQSVHDDTPRFHGDPKLGWLLIASLALHLVAVLVLGGYLAKAPRPDRRPVYYVDLVHKPVLNPQAGRPDPRPADQPRPAPAAPVQPASPPAPAKAAPKPAAAPTKPAVLPAAKPAVKPAPDKTVQNQQLSSAIDELRARQQRQAEIDALKQRLAQMQQGAAPATVPADVPVGMPSGAGSEAGVAADAYIQAYIQQNWALSPYLLDRARLGTVEARVLLVYSASGELVRFKVEKESGDSQFDDSIKRAIIKSKQLPEKLPQQIERIVIFNLKEMAEARR